MPTPFPGMDPYLERRDRWPAVHTRLIVAMADALGPQVRPRYRVDIELRTYIALVTSESLAGIPDVLVMSLPHEVGRAMAPGSALGIALQVTEGPMPEELHERFLVVREVATQDVVHHRGKGEDKLGRGQHDIYQRYDNGEMAAQEAGADSQGDAMSRLMGALWSQ